MSRIPCPPKPDMITDSCITNPVPKNICRGAHRGKMQYLAIFSRNLLPRIF
jgi:hypothetical protein